MILLPHKQLFSHDWCLSITLRRVLYSIVFIWNLRKSLLHFKIFILNFRVFFVYIYHTEYNAKVCKLQDELHLSGQQMKELKGQLESSTHLCCQTKIDYCILETKYKQQEEKQHKMDQLQEIVCSELAQCQRHLRSLERRAEEFQGKCHPDYSLVCDKRSVYIRNR